MTRRVFIDEVAYIVWEAKPWVERATDTFVVRDGRIRFQIFTTFPTPRQADAGISAKRATDGTATIPETIRR